MDSVKFVIVKSSLPNDNLNKNIKTYYGMNRWRMGSFADVPEPLLLQGLALEDLAPTEAAVSYQAFMKELLATGIKEYDLLAIGNKPGNDWQFLGYDVGETNKAAWSAIVNREVFLSPEDQVKWERKLNSYGLFQEYSDAEAYLELYLNSDDPDKGWTSEGWTDAPNGYAVVPIYRYCG